MNVHYGNSDVGPLMRQILTRRGDSVGGRTSIGIVPGLDEERRRLVWVVTDGLCFERTRVTAIGQPLVKEACRGFSLLHA